MALKPLKMFPAVMLILTAAALSGCSARARLYPIQGPLAAQTPPPVFAGRLTVNANFRSGTFTAVLDSGETFKGTLYLVQSVRKTRLGQAEEKPPAFEGMAEAWDTIYGPGYYLAHVLGEGQYGRALMTGSKGTVLQMELHSSVAGTGAEVQVSQPKGVAKDSKGNLYKVVLG